MLPPQGEYAVSDASSLIASATSTESRRHYTSRDDVRSLISRSEESLSQQSQYYPQSTFSTRDFMPDFDTGSSSSESYRSNPFRTPSIATVSGKFSLSPDPRSWGSILSPNIREPDDELHNPDPNEKDSNGTIFTVRGLANMGCLFLLATSLVALFAGYPIVSHFVGKRLSNLGGFNLGGINATGQVMEMDNWALIDPDTPEEARTYLSNEDGENWQLVFSDEFNVDGRTFYPGDDPFWEAMDMHYWGTVNLEWYDPQQITTVDGKLAITLDEVPNHGLNYTGGIMTTWNKFCFTGGIIVTSVMLPGSSQVPGLWPAVWTMGNLGRAGYGATVDGMWPYTYEACDIGTLPNQTMNGQPEIALTSGTEYYDYELSYLPGQRLSSCTCPGEEHPGPVNKDGTFVGRSAPEIDILEAQVSAESRTGHASMSSQWAPFDAFYSWKNETYLTIYDEEHAELNTYRGAAYQQTTSCIVHTNQECYELDGGCFSEYGFEYKPGYEDDGAYITWIHDGRAAWRFGAGGMGANELTQISARPVPKEPMYIIANLGISGNFGAIDFENLQWPATMLIDYIRVYQHPDRINIGCDPPNYPTNNYINRFIEAYTNPNLTTWVDDYKQEIPRSSLLDEC